MAELTGGWQVLDSAVKIGLGALIGGAGNYLLMHLSHKRELTKDGARRRRELIEAVALEVERFNHTALKYWALITEWHRYAQDAKEMPEARREELDGTVNELFHGWKELTNAEARLMLLGERTAQQALRTYGEVVKALRTNITRSTQNVDIAEMEGTRLRILDARGKFYDALSCAYSNPLT